MASIEARLAALQKEKEMSAPNGGILIRLTDTWLAISAATLNKNKTRFDSEAEARTALKGCKSVWELI